MKTLLKYTAILGLLLLGTIGKLSAMTPIADEGHSFRKYFNISEDFDVQEGESDFDETGYYNPRERQQDLNILIEEKYEEEDDDEEGKVLQARIIYDQHITVDQFNCCLLDTYYQKTIIPSLQYVVEPISHRFILLENFRL